MLRFISRPLLKVGRGVTRSSLQQFLSADKRLLLFTLRNEIPCVSFTCQAKLKDLQQRGFAELIRQRASNRKPHQRGSPASPHAENDLDSSKSESPETFGEYSSEFRSRTHFKKSSPEYLDQKYEDDVEVRLVPNFKSRTGRPNTPYWYFLQCKKLIKENKLAEALAMFETEMLQGERLPPEEFNYTVLIGGCGRVGYLKMAFKLYNDMKKRGLEPSDATYTALFNACAESPWKQSALEQALKLEQELRLKNVPLHSITHHALLKTMALTSDLQNCLRVLQDMLEAGQPITQETFHYLLMNCVQDKKNGFRLALQVWRQMLALGLKPDTPNYNILLRATRDCGLGDVALAEKVLLKATPDSNVKLVAAKGRNRSRPKDTSPSRPLLDMDAFSRELFVEGHSDLLKHSSQLPNELPPTEGATHTMHKYEECTVGSLDSCHHSQVQTSSLTDSSPAVVSTKLVTPNLLDPATVSTDVVALGTVNDASDRLALIGGMEGFLGNMIGQGLKPTLKTLTLLANVMKASSKSVQKLLAVAEENKLWLDKPFFNSLVRRSADSGDLQGAKAVMELMHSRKLYPNVQTFSNMALACNKKRDGLQLLEDMESRGILPNVHVYSSLIRQASRRLDYDYLKKILESMAEKQVGPNEVILRQLEFAAQYPPSYDRFKSKNTYLEKIDGFRGYYSVWLELMPGQETPHPWARFKTASTASDQQGE